MNLEKKFCFYSIYELLQVNIKRDQTILNNYIKINKILIIIINLQVTIYFYTFEKFKQKHLKTRVRENLTIIFSPDFVR